MQNQALVVKMDPRVTTRMEALGQQLEASMLCCQGMTQAQQALARLRKFRARLKELQARAGSGELADQLAQLDRKAAALAGSEPRFGEPPGLGLPEPGLGRLSGELSRLLTVLQSADAAPTIQAMAACREKEKELHDLLQRWQQLQKEIAALNQRLQEQGLGSLTP